MPGPSLRLKFLPVQENLPEPGFVLKNSLRAEIVIRAERQMLQITCKAPNLQICSFEGNVRHFNSGENRRDSGVNFCDRARIRVIGWIL